MSSRQNADAWHVAALTMMTPEQLSALFAGDQKRALPWVRAAARLGIAEAQVRLGRMFLAGEGVDKDESAAFVWFRCAAESGNVDAENMTGYCYENGWGIPRDAAHAAIWYTRAAEAGDAWAQYNLAHLCLDGNGVARDRDAAFHWYRRAAGQGHPRAMSLVGRCYEEGWGTGRDVAEACDWYRRSAEAGYFRGAFNYASVLAEEGFDAEAVAWFRHALELAPEDKRGTLSLAWRRARTDRPPFLNSPPRTPGAPSSAEDRRHSL